MPRGGGRLKWVGPGQGSGSADFWGLKLNIFLGALSKMPASTTPHPPTVALPKAISYVSFVEGMEDAPGYTCAIGTAFEKVARNVVRDKDAYGRVADITDTWDYFFNDDGDEFFAEVAETIKGGTEAAFFARQLLESGALAPRAAAEEAPAVEVPATPEPEEPEIEALVETPIDEGGDALERAVANTGRAVAAAERAIVASKERLETKALGLEEATEWLRCARESFKEMREVAGVCMVDEEGEDRARTDIEDAERDRTKAKAELASARDADVAAVAAGHAARTAETLAKEALRVVREAAPTPVSVPAPALVAVPALVAAPARVAAAVTLVIASQSATLAVANAEKAVAAALKRLDDIEKEERDARSEHREAKSYLKQQLRLTDNGRNLDQDYLAIITGAVPETKRVIKVVEEKRNATAAALSLAQAALEVARTAEVAAKEALRAGREDTHDARLVARRAADRVAARVVLPVGVDDTPTVVRFLVAEYGARTASTVTVVVSAFRERLMAFARAADDDIIANIHMKTTTIALQAFGITTSRDMSARYYTVPWKLVRAKIAADYPTAGMPTEDEPAAVAPVVVPAVVVAPSKVAAWLAGAYASTGNDDDAVGASMLYAAYAEDTGDAMTVTAFGKAMATAHDKKRFMRLGARSGVAYIGLRRIV